MLSAPTGQTEICASPIASDWITETMACAPDPHSRFTFNRGRGVGDARLHRGDAGQVHVLGLGG